YLGHFDLMAQRHRLSPRLSGRGDGAELIRVHDDAATYRAHRVTRQLLAGPPDGDRSVGETDLHGAATDGRLAGQPVEHPVIGDVAIPADLARLGAEAFPGIALRHAAKRLGPVAIHGPLPRGLMHLSVAPVTPGLGLLV